MFITDAIGGHDLDMVQKELCHGLTMEWEVVRGWLRRSVLNGPRLGESKRIVRMGPERICVGIRSWRKLYIPHLLKVTLFGKDLRCFHQYESMQYGKGGSVKKKLFHISSQSRLKRLFTINEWCGVEFDGEIGKITCCGRVNVVRMRGTRLLNQIGFVLEETVDKLHVRLENKDLVWLPKPKWDNQSGYIYLSVGSSYTINEYDPVRLLFSLDGHIQILFHRITLQNHTNYLVIQ